MNLSQFVASTLRRTGAVTEARDDDLVYALLPDPVATGLGIPEEARLRLRGLPGHGETHAGYGSVLLSQICSLTEGAGRRCRVQLTAAAPKRERVEREAQAVISFQNAVGRIDGFEDSILEYLVFDFHYAAVSEETHEGLVTVAFQAGGGSNPGVASSLASYLSEHHELRRPWSGEAEHLKNGEHLRVARSLALQRAFTEIGPFVARLERRLQRDARRVEEYYGALRREVETRGTKGRETPETLDGKLEAIDTEKIRKQHDQRRRYSVTLRIEPLSVLAVRVRGLRLWCRVQRRKRERRASLGWNPIARQFDVWICEACGGEAKPAAVCDALHVLCSACDSDCPKCGRAGCPACRALPCSCGWRRDPPAWAST